MTLTVTADGLSDTASRDFRVTPPRIGVTVTKQGPGDGTVGGAGLTCSSTGCQGSYLPDTRVQLTGHPAAESRFVRWDGCAPETARTCSLTVDRGSGVEVTFEEQDSTPPAPSLTGGGQTVRVGSSGRTVSLRGSDDSLSLTATATDGLSAVTRTQIWVSSRWTCVDAAGRRREDGAGDAPLGDGNGDSAEHVVDANRQDRCGGDFPVLAAATFQPRARATSEGGESPFTSILTVDYSP